MDASPQPIFDAGDRANLDADPSLRAYRDITKAQLVGLLCALGEYAIRVGPDYVPEGVKGLESLDAHRAVVGFYWHSHLSADSPSPPWYFLDRTVTVSPPEESIFDLRERQDLSRRKYVRGHEGITRDQLRGLLLALGRYSQDAPLIPELPEVVQGPTRMIHAHNALVMFAERPFTSAEFVESLHAVLRGEMSRLTPSRGRSGARAADEHL